MQTSAVYDQIAVLSASGSGSTALAAFHAALVEAGLGHYNIVRLSSVIPPGTAVDATGKASVPDGAWGDRMYCVYAEQRVTTAGEAAWAGIGWVQRLDGLGGLFVEHEGTSERAVVRDLRATLGDVVAGREDEFTEPDWVVNGVLCTGQPVCALVVAPYESVSWVGSR